MKFMAAAKSLNIKKYVLVSTEITSFLLSERIYIANKFNISVLLDIKWILEFDSFDIWESE